MHQMAKVLEFQLQHLSSEYSGLISFRIDCFALLAVQGTLNLLQNRNLKYSGLISFRIDCFDLLAVQGTLNLQNHNLKASVFQCLSFFTVQLSHPYMTTGKTITLAIWYNSDLWARPYATYIY